MDPAARDPPRADSRALLAQLQSLGVRTVMITGDAAATAATVARAVGLEGPICPPEKIPDSIGPHDFAVYAGVFPEEKFRLVKAFQQRGHAVGMCGDGANDAPALRQAQMGIAVLTATDVAKALSLVAGRPESDIVLVNAQNLQTLDVSDISAVMTVEVDRQLAARQSRTALRRAVTLCRKAQARFVARAELGSPAETIDRIARELGAHQIVMGTAVSGA